MQTIALGEMMQAKDARVSDNVMNALLQMKKLDIKKLKQAYEQKPAATTTGGNR